MSQQWRGGGPKDRFGDERKPIVDRPPVLYPPDECWCGEKHDQRSENPKYWGAGIHPWPPLDIS